jgi:nitrogen fixation/metabolism regulation signal transduction histidine kinase
MVSLELHPVSRILAPRALRYVLLGCAVLGTVFLFLLATASANTELFASNYNLLLVLNGTMVALLMGLVGYQLWRLRKNLKEGVFGSRLAIRLVLLFALVAVLPGALLYGVSVQFLGKSIESWFDVRVDRALEGGLNLGRNALEYLLKETTNKASQLALTLQEGDVAIEASYGVLGDLLLRLVYGVVDFLEVDAGCDVE